MIEGLFREGKSFALFPFRVYYAPSLALAKGRGKDDVGAETGKRGKGDAGAEAGGRGKDDAGAEADGRGKDGRDAGSLQAGFGASSRNFKKAVDRNRIKRLTREAYRLQKNPLRERLEENGRSLALFFIYIGKELPDSRTVTEKIGLILQKLLKETGG